MLLALPWFTLTSDNLDINRAESVFSKHHYGLDKVKERILDFLAAKTLRSLAKPRMLVVDDETVAQSNMSYFFNKQGFSVKMAGNGKEALEIMSAGPGFDIVLTDLKMDQMDGLELLDHIKCDCPAYQCGDDYRLCDDTQCCRCIASGGDPLSCQAGGSERIEERQSMIF